MSIPYYREVQYTDDGCYRYQCLSCYATWEWRWSSEPLQYCMCCGLKFNGQHECRDHEMPVWRFNYAKIHGEYAAWNLKFPAQPLYTWWAIEKKTVWIKSGEILDDWKVTSVLRGRYTAKDALEALKQARKDEEPDEDWMSDSDLWATTTLLRLTRVKQRW